WHLWKYFRRKQRDRESNDSAPPVPPEKRKIHIYALKLVSLSGLITGISTVVCLLWLPPSLRIYVVVGIAMVAGIIVATMILIEVNRKSARREQGDNSSEPQHFGESGTSPF
ncbi:MAG: hypothetical protein V3T31_12960, partial [candidate division Zixibacteria bacterium]